MLVLGMGVAKSQVFILGNPLFPSIGAMVHFQTMEVERLGFYNYAIYGHSNKPEEHMQNLKLAGGLSYYFSEKNDPQSCFRIYWGFNYQVFWDMTHYEDVTFPPGYKNISFDLGVSKSFDNGVSLMVMLDPINNFDCKVGGSYYF
jgi:hypothetical protein